MSSPWIKNGKLQLWDHMSDQAVSADEENKMCPFTLGYCQSVNQMPATCFKDACELWDPEMKRCSLSDRVRD